MKLRFFSLTLAALALAACDQSAKQRAEEQARIAEQRAKEAEQRLAQRETDIQNAELDRERQRLADAQAALEAERQKLETEKAAARDDANKMTRLKADEAKLAEREATLKEQERAAQARRDAEHLSETRGDLSEQKLDFFYTALEPMGDWLEVEPYGYCWQPHEARNPAWRPYTDGSWAYTEYGWTWKGSEPFNWAVYHYGRWARVHGTGWVWVPGSEWAPAWVAWRRSPEYIGWAPLPPEAHSGNGFTAAVDSYYDIGPAAYTFVPVKRFGEPSYREVVVPAERNVTIINNTVNITKINYTTVENKTVVFNGGPDFAQVNAASALAVPKMQLRRDAIAPKVGVRGSTVEGNVLRLAAPNIVSAGRPAAAPKRVKEQVKGGEIERGWQGGDAQAVQAIRTRQREEATQAEQQARGSVAKPAPRATPPAAAPVTVPPRPAPPPTAIAIATPPAAVTPGIRGPQPNKRPGFTPPSAATPLAKPSAATAPPKVPPPLPTPPGIRPARATPLGSPVAGPTPPAGKKGSRAPTPPGRPGKNRPTPPPDVDATNPLPKP